MCRLVPAEAWPHLTVSGLVWRLLSQLGMRDGPDAVTMHLVEQDGLTTPLWPCPAGDRSLASAGVLRQGSKLLLLDVAIRCACMGFRTCAPASEAGG